MAALGGWMPLHFEVDNLHFEERLGRVLVVIEENCGNIATLL